MKKLFAGIFLKSFLVLLAVIIHASTFSCEAAPIRRVIIDTDTGGDDAGALILAAKSPKIKIEGVTVLAGNVNLDQAAKNALMSLEIAGANVPVYKGADHSLINRKIKFFSVYGKDGMGDANLIHPKNKAQKKSAIDFILETVKKYPNQVEIISLGPATNIALAIQKDPATMKNVKKIWSMGTAGFGHGNATPVAEFNTFNDAEAYKVMLDSGIPVTIISWQIANDENLCLDRKILDEMKNSSPTQKFIAMANEKYAEYCDNMQAKKFPFSDSVAVAAATWEDFILESEMCHASCITEQNETYGQVIFYKKNYNYDTMIKFDDYQIEVVTKVKSANFIPRYRARI